MTTKLKRVSVAVKAAGPDDGLEEGQFLAYASVFGNVDSYGDVVEKGAFADTLKAWAASDDVLPLLWGHDFSDPFSNIGGVLEAKEDDHGLLIKAQLDLDNPKAAQVYRLLKGRRVNQMSFAYDIVEGGWEKSEELGEYFSLKKLNIHECSVVPLGANQETEVLVVKGALDTLSDNVLTKGVIDSLQELQGQLQRLLEKHDQKASGTPKANADASDDKSSVSGEEPKASPSVALSAQLNLLEMEGN